MFMEERIRNMVVKSHENMEGRSFTAFPDVLLPSDCMKLLAVGRSTVYRLLRNGEIKSIRVGKKYRIPKKSVQKYLESCYNCSSN